LLRGVNLRGEIVCDGVPGFPESAVCLAAIAEATDIGQAIVYIGDPGAQAAAASEREHEELVCVVGAEEPSYITPFGGPGRYGERVIYENGSWGTYSSNS
jgi:hypothetical protein